jgi:hypothetical protein
MAATKDFQILQGKTWSQVVRWEAPPIIYKPITAITQTAPARITATAHGAPAGWRVAVVSVKGMTQINAENSPPKDKDYHTATVIDPNTVELNDVNAAEFKAYISGGYLQFNTPVSLAGFVARMKIKDKVGGTVLASTEVADAPKNIITATVSDTNKSITLTISATSTAALTWTKGVYDLELESPGGVVTALLTGSITVTKEVTTN